VPAINFDKILHLKYSSFYLYHLNDTRTFRALSCLSFSISSRTLCLQNINNTVHTVLLCQTDHNAIQSVMGINDNLFKYKNANYAKQVDLSGV